MLPFARSTKHLSKSQHQVMKYLMWMMDGHYQS